MMTQACDTQVNNIRIIWSFFFSQCKFCVEFSDLALCLYTDRGGSAFHAILVKGSYMYKCYAQLLHTKGIA